MNGEEIDSVTSSVSLDSGLPLQIGRATTTAIDYEGFMDDVRITKGEALWTSNFTPPTEPATATENTKLLLHMDGAEGSSTFTDSSSTPHSVTPNGAPKISGLADEFGDAMYFDGTGDYLSIPDNADWNFGSGNFTIDTWVYIDNRSVNNTIYSHGTTSQTYEWFVISTTGGITFRSSYLDTQEISLNSAAGEIEANTWYHLAVTRSGNDFKIFKNGVVIVSETDTSALRDQTGQLRIGVANSPDIGNWGYYLNGYLDEVRVTKGEARWTSDFSASLPTGPATSDTNTKLLLHLD